MKSVRESKQLAMYLLALARGDLGHSYALGQPVAQIILSRLPTTLLLMLTALALSTTAGQRSAPDPPPRRPPTFRQLPGSIEKQ